MLVPAQLIYLYVPPPVGCPHIVIHAHLPFRIHIDTFRCITCDIFEEGIADELTYTLDRVPVPQLDSFLPQFSFLVRLVPDGVEELDLPLCKTAGQTVYLLVE